MIAKAMFLWKSAFGSQRKERRGEERRKSRSGVLYFKQQNHLFLELRDNSQLIFFYILKKF
jgi:hypothetical protein